MHGDDSARGSPDTWAQAIGMRQPRFAETRWTLVIRAGRSKSPRAQLALTELCQVYYYPLYADVRRRGQTAADADDLTQAFFAHLLGDDLIAGADRAKGRFRSYLLPQCNGAIPPIIPGHYRILLR